MPRPRCSQWLSLLVCGALGAQLPTRPVASVRPQAEARAAAAHIDTLLQNGRSALGVAALPLLDDSGFVRRAYLQVVGRIPTRSETEAFLADARADKRSRLVDQLLDSPGHTSATVDWWFDLLRVKSRLRQLSGEPFAHWVREAVRTDMPYDAFVQAMLTASGPAHKEGHGATGYLMRDANMPHDAMANTLRLFLGTRLECAQCHNHPTDHWTQKEFFGMAAFFGGIRYRSDLDREALGALRQAANAGDDRTKQAARRALQTMAQGIAGSGTGLERLPDDYKYDDAKPKEAVYATTIFGNRVELPRATNREASRPRLRGRALPPAPPAEVDSRAAFAQWLASADNPRFLTVITGRVWQRLFGRALVPVVDDLRDDTKAVYPELQRYLETLLVDLHFDLRQFERVLCLTDLFQRACPASDPPADQPYAFAGPVLRRMSAEQIWDSLLTLVFDDLDPRIRPTDARAREVYDRYAQVAASPPDQLDSVLAQGRRPTPAAAPLLELAKDGERQQQARALVRAFAAARRAGNAAEVERITVELRELGLPVPGERAARGREGEFVRASDQLQPAPAGHLLRQFGQSDRETIDAANREANVPQALTLLNGFLDQRVLNGASSLRNDLAAARTPADKVRAAYCATLSRPPRPAELSEWQAAVERDAETALRDLVWVLCNSNEFRFLP